MTQWANSLIRISNYEVETLQKRLAEIAARRVSAELRIATLDAEREIERARAEEDQASAMMWSAYDKGWKLRRSGAEAELATVGLEEAGAREALTRAYEELKKFEHVAELSRLSAVAARAKRETAQLDEMALRRQAG